MRIKISFGIGLLFIFMFVFSCVQAIAADDSPPHQNIWCGGELGKITSFSGEVQLKSKVSPPAGQWQKVTKADFPVFLKDYVKTLQGKATITFNDKTQLDLDAQSEIMIDEFYLSKENKITRNIKCALGKITADIKPRKDLQVQFETPSGIAAIKGSYLTLDISPQGKAGINLQHGNLDFSNADTKSTFSMEDGNIVNALYNATENSIEVESVQGIINVLVPNAVITLNPTDIVAAAYDRVTGTVKITSRRGNISVTTIDPKTGKKTMQIIPPSMSITTQAEVVSVAQATTSEHATETNEQMKEEKEEPTVKPVIPEEEPTYTEPTTESEEEEEEEPTTDIYVDSVNGSNDNMGNESTPLKTLTYAIAKIKEKELSNVTIHLAAGSYNKGSGEEFPIGFKNLNRVTIDGTSKENVTIDGALVNNQGTLTDVFEVANVTGSNYIKNVKITGGTRGIKVLGGSEIVISSCNITGNNGENGVGIYVGQDGGTGTINIQVNQCEIHDNTESSSTCGAGIYIDAQSAITFTIARSKIYSNKSTTGMGGGIKLRDSGNGALNGGIHNTLFYDNSAEYGGAIYFEGVTSNVKIVNCTIAGNTAAVLGGQGVFLNASSPVFKNTIFNNNGAVAADVYEIVATGTCRPSFNHCDIWHGVISWPNNQFLYYDNQGYPTSVGGYWPSGWDDGQTSKFYNPQLKANYHITQGSSIIKGTALTQDEINNGYNVDLDGIQYPSTSSPTLGCFQTEVSASDPVVSGRVYDSVTGDTVSGPVVGIYRVNEQTALSTTHDNPYSFTVDTSSYYFAVSKDGYGFPSNVVSATGNGSHGETFTVLNDPVSIDIPIDPKDMLTITKTCNKKKVMVGDIVTYNIKIENNYWFKAVENVTLKDDVINGCNYVKGSTYSAQGTAERTKTNDPAITSRIASFNIGAVPAYTTMNLSYQVRVGSGMVPGRYTAKGICVKSATGDTCSNESSVMIELVEDVLFDKGTIIGKVFLDLNANGVQDRAKPETSNQKPERGIAGVRIATEYGVVVETDRDGKYHIADVPAGRHLLKVDPSSIPPEIAQLGGGNIQFTTENPHLVKITEGLLAKVNFGIATESSQSQSVKVSECQSIMDQFFIVALGEGELRHLDTSGNIEMINKDDRYDSGFKVDGRLSFYLKGKVLGKYLITASLDTDRVRTGAMKRDAQSRLIKNLDPDKYYPVYGDASKVDYSATDTQDIAYVLVEWDESYAKWGSFVTNLPLYNRTLSGGKVEYRSVSKTKFGEPYTEIDGYYAVSRQVPRHEEFVGTGASLYYLEKRDVVEGSEKMKVEVRDRISKRVIFSYILNEGIDYEIDYDTGRILLKRPLSSVNWRYNSSVVSTDILTGERVYLVVDYEYYTLLNMHDQSYGGRVKQHITSYTAIEGQYVEEHREDDKDPYQLYSAKGELRLNKDTVASVRYSHSKETQMGSGSSFDGGLSFVELASTNSDGRSGSAVDVGAETRLFNPPWQTDIRLYYTRQDPYFSATDSIANAGTEKYIAEILSKLKTNLAVGIKHVTTKILEGTVLEDITGNVNTNVTTAFADWNPGKWDTRLEYQHQDVNKVIEDYTFFGTLPIQDDDFIAGRIGYTINDWLHPYIRGQGTVKGYVNNQGTAGVDVKLFGGKTVFALAETVGNLGNSTLLGLTSELDDTRSAYTNVEVGNRIGLGKFTKTSYGENLELTPNSRAYMSTDYSAYQEGVIRGNLLGYNKQLTDNLLLGLSYERSNVERKHFSNVINRDSGSISISYLNIDTLKIFSKLECREDRGNDTKVRQWITENEGLWYITPDVSVLGRANWSSTQDRLEDRTEARFHELGAGIAYRPIYWDRINVLAKYSYLTDLPPEIQDDFAESTDSRQNVFSVEGSLDITKYLELVGKVAYRDKNEKVGERGWTESDKYLYLARLNFHVTDKWDIAGEYRILECPDIKDRKQGWLLEIDREVVKFMRVGVGYNFTDFNGEVSDDNYDSKGFFARITGKY